MTKQRAAKAKAEADREPKAIAVNTIMGLLGAAASGQWRTLFQVEILRDSHRLGQQVIGHSELLTRSGAIPRIDVASDVLNAIFGLVRPDHAFDHEPLRWGFGLTEPMATKTLARLLSAGSGETRARRVSAFLQAVGLPEDCASLRALERCRIVAEQDHIDMKLVWADDAGRDVVVIIEAKFGHKITKGQLSGYWAAVKKAHGCQRPFASILLTLDNSVCAVLKNQQRINWKQVDWRNFWLRFERLRPIEHNPALQMFLRTLWHRSGSLTQEDRHGRI